MSGKRTRIEIPEPELLLAPVWKTDLFEIDESRRLLRVNGVEVRLESKPFDFLLMLTKRSEQVISKDDFLQWIWNGRVLSDSVLAKCVSKIRSALGDDQQTVIRTVHGIGYQLTLSAARDATVATARREPTKATEPIKSHSASVTKNAVSTAKVRAVIALALGRTKNSTRYSWSSSAKVSPEVAVDVANAVEDWLRLSFIPAPTETGLVVEQDDDTHAMLVGAAEVIEKLFTQSPDIYGSAVLSVTLGLQGIGLRPQAHALLKRTLSCVQTLGSPLSLDLRIQLADLATEMGQYDEAEMLFNGVLVEAEAWFGSRSAAMLDARQGSGLLRYERHEFVDAERLLRSLLDDTRCWYPQDLDRANRVCWGLSKVLLRRNELKEAESLLENVMRSWTNEMEVGGTVQSGVHLTQAALRAAQGKPTEAASICDKVLQRTAAFSAEMHQVRMQAFYQRGLVASKQGRRAEAAADLAAASQLAHKYFGEAHPVARDIASSLTRA